MHYIATNNYAYVDNGDVSVIALTIIVLLIMRGLYYNIICF